MNILVLGGEGQIGKPLCGYLERSGHSVVSRDKVIGQDLSIYSCRENLIKDCLWADKVIFLAFEVGGSKYLEKKDKEYEYIRENVDLMSIIFGVLWQTNKPFLFASSQMANMFHTNYGFLKNLGERYTRTLDNGWICRFWNVYGKEDPNSEKSHVITDLIYKAKTEPTIKLISQGNERRQFLHTEDCNRAIEQWVNGVWDDNKQYYDITSFTWVSIAEIATIIAKKYNKVWEPGAKMDTIQRGIENKPDEYILKFWKPELDLEAGIDKVI